MYAKIDDHGVRRGHTGQIFAQWQRPVASRVALDLPYWGMCLALYRLIHMAIEMAREAGAMFFFVFDFMSCITVAKRPCYGPLKFKPSYNIVRYCVLIYFVYYGSSPIVMNAVLAIIAGGGRAIFLIYREAVEIH